MERIDKILKAENTIQDPVHPQPLKEVKKDWNLKIFHSAMTKPRNSEKHINLTVEKVRPWLW